FLTSAERLHGGGIAEQAGRAFDRLGEHPPGAGAVVGLATLLVNLLAKDVGRLDVVLMELAKLYRVGVLASLLQGLLVRFHGRQFAAKQGVESLDGVLAIRHDGPPIMGQKCPRKAANGGTHCSSNGVPTSKDRRLAPFLPFFWTTWPPSSECGEAA